MDPRLLLISWLAVATGLLCAAAVAVHVWRHPQQMWIVDVVWPRHGALFRPARSRRILDVRSAVHPCDVRRRRAAARDAAVPETAIAATHCGAGCTLGDLAAEWFVVAVPLSLFGQRVFGTWPLDFALALAIGVAFQYFTIVPMRHLPPGKRDRGSAQSRCALADRVAGRDVWLDGSRDLWHLRYEPPKGSPVFWLMMQLAMLAGFATAYPVNWWLLRSGLKEQM